jgi:hypothetical protein
MSVSFANGGREMLDEFEDDSRANFDVLGSSLLRGVVADASAIPDEQYGERQSAGLDAVV